MIIIGHKKNVIPRAANPMTIDKYNLMCNNYWMN